MSLLSELQLMKNYPASFGVAGPLGVRSEGRSAVKSVVETIADLATQALVPLEDSEEFSQRTRRLLLEQEVDVTINAYPVFRNEQTEAEEAQGIRGKIFLIKRDSEGREIERTLWRLVVDFKEEED